MLRSALLGTALALGLAGSASAADGMKLWQLSSGTLTLDKSGLTAGKDIGKMITVPVAMYVIQHPRGLVVFDTGNSANVSGDGCNAYWGEGLCKAITPKQSRDEVIDRQLEKLGFKVDDVKYVIYSHFHLDHAGNIELFPKATHVAQKKELQFAWWPEKWYSGAYVMKDYDETRNFNFLELAGDFDLFGDGTIQVLSTPGHTAGHQSVMVKLPKTGALVLTGDAVYTTENEQGVAAGLALNLNDSFASTARLKMLRDATGGQLWFSHDPAQFATHQHDKPYE